MFPVVAVGASAGGLEALEQFLSNVPEKSGMAYVVIQHLDPTQKGMLPELLQRVSPIKVFQVKNHMEVKPDCVYVIPPNKSMFIEKGILHLSKPIETRGLRLPIDFFFRSLAQDRKQLSVGIILSGMGSDGSIGIRAIRENNGIIMVQDPAMAKFDSMPRNAMEAVLVDVVAPANELPERLIALVNNAPASISDGEIEMIDKSALRKIITQLMLHTGNDFSLYKKSTMYRRIERRMGVHKINKISDYIPFLSENPKEIDILFKELLIGVTNFFRDMPVWEKLKETVIPSVIAAMESGSILRAWVIGCSTGEEAYSLAIVFKEIVHKIVPHGGVSLQIFATDLDQDAIDSARKGIYPANIAVDVSPDRLNRFFVATDEGYRVTNEIREMVVFAQHNIIIQPPFTKIDVLLCRNLLIYMEHELQNKLLGLFHYSINPERIMVLGSSESLGSQNKLFTPIDSKLKIFRRSLTSQDPTLYDFPASFSRSKPISAENQTTVKMTPNIETLADQLLLQHLSPVGVLVNGNGDILYTTGRTGKYLEPAVGKANMNIFAMLRDGLRNEFPPAFRKAILKKEKVELTHLKVDANGDSRTLNVNIQWIAKPELLNGTIMIIFTDVPEVKDNKPPASGGENAPFNSRQLELEKELQDMREEMQNSFEEMQTSQEELKSTNEELQSANEELQSTNEELTSSKEEMQSLNEELQTVNAELQAKIDDFSRVDNDMKNLLNSTDIATLFLDKELNIRRYTNQATKIFKLIKSDIGRPFTDLFSDLIYPDLANDAREVLKTLAFIQKPIPASNGRWFSIRIMPYRTFDDRIDGLVITFINISDQKMVELKFHEADRLNQLFLNSSSDIIIKLSPDWEIMEFNPEAEKFFGEKRKTILNQNFIQLFIPESDQKKMNKEMSKLLKSKEDGTLDMQVKTAKGNIQGIKWLVYVTYDYPERPAGMLIIAKKSKS